MKKYKYFILVISIFLIILGFLFMNKNKYTKSDEVSNNESITLEEGILSVDEVNGYVKYSKIIDNNTIIIDSNSSILNHNIETKNTTTIHNQKNTRCNFIFAKRLEDNKIAIVNVNEIIIYDPANGDSIIIDMTDYEEFDISYDGKKIVYITSDNDIFVSNMDFSNKELISYDKQEGYVGVIPRWSLNNYNLSFLMPNKNENNIAFYNSKECILSHYRLETGSHYNNLKWIDDNRVIYISDNYSYIYDSNTGEELYQFESDSLNNASPEPSPDGKYIAFMDGDSLKLLDIDNSFKMIDLDKKYTNYLNQITWNNDEYLIITTKEKEDNILIKDVKKYVK